MEGRDGLSYCQTSKLLIIIGNSSARQSGAFLDWLAKEAFRTSDA